MKINIVINNKQTTIDVEPMKRLLDVLRDDFGLIGVKESCGEGECGACAVLLDGTPVASCIVNAIHADGKEIMTVEGVSETDLGKLLIECFDETNAVQCGFCFPGFMISSYHYLKTDGEPNLIKIKAALAGNICRCGAYAKIFDSVLMACKRKEKWLSEAKK